MEEIKQMCQELINSSTLSSEQKQVWLQTILEKEVDESLFLQLEAAIEASVAEQAIGIDAKLQTVLSDIDKATLEFNQKFSNLAADASLARQNLLKQKEEQMLANIRSKLGI